jgi:hypothetical protein
MPGMGGSQEPHAEPVRDHASGHGERGEAQGASSWTDPDHAGRVYRSLLDTLGAGLDRVLLHKAAATTTGSLLTRLRSAPERHGLNT